MLHTEKIVDEAKLSQCFKWLNEHQDLKFRDYALEAFRAEMSPPYKPLSKCNYYITYVDKNELLLIRTTPNLTSIGISFSRIFDKLPGQGRTEAHLWIKNALDGKIISECKEMGITYINIKPMTPGARRVCEALFNMLSNENWDVNRSCASLQIRLKN